MARERNAKVGVADVGCESEAARRFADLAGATGFDATALVGDHILDLLRRHLSEVEERVR